MRLQPLAKEINPTVESRADIKLYLDNERARNFSWLNGTRKIENFFTILDLALCFSPPSEYVLQKQGSEPPICRNSLGNITAGTYYIVPLKSGTRIYEETLLDAFTAPDKKSLENDGRNIRVGSLIATGFNDFPASSTDSAVLKDPGEYTFRQRLIYRDKGCVICHARGTMKDYTHEDHSRLLQGSHIFPFSMPVLVLPSIPLMKCATKRIQEELTRLKMDCYSV